MDWQVPAVEYFRQVPNAEQAWKSITELDELRHDYGYPTDGAVIKLDSFAQHSEAGSTAKSPAGQSLINSRPKGRNHPEDIRLQVGRTGTVTPVAWLTPVNLRVPRYRGQACTMPMKSPVRISVSETGSLWKSRGDHSGG